MDTKLSDELYRLARFADRHVSGLKIQSGDMETLRSMFSVMYTRAVELEADNAVLRGRLKRANERVAQLKAECAARPAEKLKTLAHIMQPGTNVIAHPAFLNNQ
jgi:hypothetical protein